MKYVDVEIFSIVSAIIHQLDTGVYIDLGSMFRFIHSGVDQLVLGMRAIMGEMVELRPWQRYQS